MSKSYAILFFLLCSLFSHAQEKYTIKGKVIGANDKFPLESATVYFTTVKDSTMLEYTLTDKNGDFILSVKKQEKPVFLKVTYMGFETHKELVPEINGNRDFNTIALKESANMLSGVTIITEEPPIRVKNDTIEFKASLFKVRPDSNVETLLKQLPGFEVDSDGKITVNGKEVNQVLVNGKPFFDRDGVMALKNLPADIINKVQVSDYKTKKEEYTKSASSSDNASINLTIDKEKNKGYFGKFLGGYGTDDRYESSFIVNLFDNNRKISLLGSSNNINAPGFSMDEVFDNMGGGRNARGNTSKNGAKGITKSNLLGLNYSDEWINGLQTSANYNFSNTETDNLYKSKAINFLPTGNFTTESESKTKNDNTSHKAGVELEYKAIPSIQIFAAPKFSSTKSDSYSDSRSNSTDENGTLTNDSKSKSSTQNDSNNFQNAINFNKTFEKKARNLSVVFNNNNSKSNSNGLTQSETTYYATQTTDNRNQNTISDSSSDSYAAEIEYTEPVTDSLRFRIGLAYNFNTTANEVRTYNFNSLNESYSELNDLQSNYTSSKQNSIIPKAGIRFEKNNFTVDINSSSSIVQYNNYSNYLNQATDLNKKYILPNVSGQVRYKFDRSKALTTRYNYSVSLPSSNQLLPVVNLSNPLNTVIGNPDLKPNEKHSANINYRNFDFRTRSGYSIFANADFYSSEIISSSVYDANRKRTTTYENISGTYVISGGGSWNKSIKQEANLLRYGISMNANFSTSKGFTDGVLFDATSTGISPRVYANYDYGEFFTVAPSYNFSYNETQYDNYLTKSSSNVVHRLNIQTTSYWPNNWTWGNDFGYTYNSKLSSEFKKDFYLWNTSLSYTFFDKNFIAKIKVYDLLNQNQSSTRTISATTIRDDENTILKRYAIFSLTYKIQDFSGMKNPPGGKNGKGRGNRAVPIDM
ncbi:outer membrane beta-barrel protein [Flavobacterium sp. GP15]|uniref:outer membrane beta-barrel protein n=1 Tax=Flavobacterium sp. GP15 TaxID=2758567 RepID=UPI00165D381D|nr:outer membrane beta-barrel protein [Flavobacterium sp. GP15]